MGVLHDGPAIGAGNCVVDIKGAARLDLDRPDRCQNQRLFTLNCSSNGDNIQQSRMQSLLLVGPPA